MTGRSLGARPLGGYPHGLHRASRARAGAYRDPSLHLYYDMRQDSASVISAMVKFGPVPTKTIASNAMSVNSSGIVAYAPHQLLENANMSDNADATPSGWGDAGEAANITWTLLGDGSYEYSAVSTNDRPAVTNDVVAVLDDSTLYTFFVYIEEATSTAGSNIIINLSETGGGTGDFFRTTGFSVAGWYGCSFETGPSGSPTTGLAVQLGTGCGAPATGTMTWRNAGLVKGLLPGVTVGSPGLLTDQSAPPLGRWIGTDDGDEPLYDQPRFTHDPANGNARLGLLEEMAAATNVALWARDLTQDGGSPWTLSNTTAAKDATGLDGNANSASTLTATGANGTCLQTVTQGSAENTYSVWVKRKTGTGDIDITDNNGTNWTTLTGLSSSSWTRHNITRTQANPVFGIRIVTSGDEVEVDVNQLEAGDKPSSEIPTTAASATRAKDIRTAGVDWLNANAGVMFKQAIIPYASAAEMTLWSIDDGSANDRLRLYMDAAENVNFETINSGDNNGASDGAAVIAVDTVFKAAGIYADDDVIGYVDGTASAVDSSAGIPVGSAATVSRWGDDSAAGTPWAGITQREKYWNTRKPNSFADAETT